MSSNTSTDNTLPTTDEAPQPNFFQQMYISTKQTGKKVPWDVGYPQPALAAVSASFQGKVLDVGCGTGDNSIYVGSLPGVSSVTAVDFSKEAISMCKERLANASSPPKAPVTFLEADVFDLPGDLCEFDTLLDSAVFHCIGDDEQQRKYLAAVTPRVKVGGTVVMFVFSDMNKVSACARAYCLIIPSVYDAMAGSLDWSPSHLRGPCEKALDGCRLDCRKPFVGSRVCT